MPITVEMRYPQWVDLYYFFFIINVCFNEERFECVIGFVVECFGFR